jgi:hypothetical protein
LTVELKEIKILGNCQVGGIAESISLLVEGSKVHGELATNNIAELGSVLSQHIECQGRLIVCDSVRSLIVNNPALKDFDRPDTIYYPSISFAAFHPDIQYAFNQGSVAKNGLGSDWNSRILLWAYLHGQTPQQARKLFNSKTFEMLGYFSEWERSSQKLQKVFRECNFDYVRWIRSVQRAGIFMYGINHPTQFALSKLSIQLAEKIFPQSLINRSNLIYLTNDHLSHIVWPIYPEIGDRLGLDSSYLWRVNQKISDLQEFSELCFQSFDRIKLRDQNLTFIPPTSSLENKILHAIVDS